MRYNLDPIPADLLPIARGQTIGAENIVSFNYQPWTDVGAILMQAPASGTLTPTSGYEAPAEGLDMVVRCANGIVSAAGVVLTFAVTFADDTTGSATATMTPPSWARDQSWNMPQGLSVDLIGTDANSTKGIKTVDSLTSIVGGAGGARFQILALPSPSSGYMEIGCVKSTEPKLPVSKSVAIPCRYDGSNTVKKGRSDPGSLDVSSRYSTYGDGLTRINGHSVTARTELWKEDQVLTERMVFENWRPMSAPKAGDGDDESEASATGMFERFCIFWPTVY
jgi:hypothetical protein